MKVNDYVYVTNIIPKEFCETIIDVIKNRDWKKHQWYSVQSDKRTSHETKELDVQNVEQDMQNKLTPILIEAGREYNQKYANINDDKMNQLFFTMSPVRFNRYEKGTVMRKHYDHIRSLFDGQRKGIPVLTLLGVLNDDYDGGQFLVNDEDFNLKQGDMILFPSCFMYPHEVKEVTKGTRYSFISWAF
jgi:predicted 2-oxoglutarate/Fe(II)-dependent dioxygenase YbiX|tara:strand:+ start:1926 stop:2489 length:564 start_codon:yes stop_codon:yes gene_type:complete